MGTEPVGQDPCPDWVTGAMTSPLEASLASSLEYMVVWLFAGLPGMVFKGLPGRDGVGGARREPPGEPWAGGGARRSSRAGKWWPVSGTRRSCVSTPLRGSRDTVLMSKEGVTRPRHGMGPRGVYGLWCPSRVVLLSRIPPRDLPGGHAISRLLWGPSASGCHNLLVP